MSSNPDSMPSIKNMALNLVSTAKDVVKDAVVRGVINASEDVSANRLNTCKECEHLSQETFRCKLCGCNMEMKVKLSAAHCPINKWHKV